MSINDLEKMCKNLGLTVSPYTVSPHKGGAIYNKNICVGMYNLQWKKTHHGMKQTVSVNWHAKNGK